MANELNRRLFLENGPAVLADSDRAARTTSDAYRILREAEHSRGELQRRQSHRRGLTASAHSRKEFDMRDEIFDREYQQGRDALNDGIDRAVAKIGDFFTAAGPSSHQAAPSMRSSSTRRGSASRRPAKRAKPVKAARRARAA